MTAQPNEFTRPGILIREWLTLAFFMALFLSIILISLIETRRSDHLLLGKYDDEVRVYIEGEVESPGMYSVKEGVPLYEALQMAGLKKSSKTLHIDRARPVIDGERIKVRALKMIEISLCYPDGFEKTVDVPLGSKISDIEYDTETTQYQLSLSNKRRTVLRNGDKVTMLPRYSRD